MERADQDGGATGWRRVRGRAWITAALLLVLVVFPAVQIVFIPRLPFLEAVHGPGRGDWWALVLWLVAWEWALLAFVAVALRAAGRDLASVGFPRLGRGEVLWGVVVLAVAAGFLLAAPPGAESGAGLVWYLPDTPPERAVWVLAALTAGVCEETLFRGFALTEIRRRTGSVVLAVLVSTAAFVLIHGLGQPAADLARRAAVGLLFAGLFLWRDDLRGPVFIHFLVDVAVLYLL